MSKIKAYISSFRLRTLPLSLAGIIAGIIFAAGETITNFITVILLINTTLSLQILSNLANEYGDIVKGTDNENRLGPIRSVQKGILSPKEIITAIVVFIVLSAVNGISLLVYSLDSIFSQQGVAFLALGGCSIIAALLYTLGKYAYGYKGLGEFFVFIFFGLISTIGAYIICGGIHYLNIILPASAIGLLSCGVLNINNMRDLENDKQCNKNTLAVRLGAKKSRIYHLGIITLALLLQTAHYCSHSASYPWFLALVPILLYHVIFVIKNEDKKLDSQMPLLSLTTLVFAIIIALGA